MTRHVFDSPVLGLKCDACQGARVGDPATLRTMIQGHDFVCSACQERRPVELAYFDALRSFPFTNCLLLANAMERGELAVPIGRSAQVAFSQEFGRLLYVNVTPQAEFPVQLSILHRSPVGFALQLATAGDPPSAAPVRVVWIAAGFRGHTLPLFLDLMVRPFQALYGSVVETEVDFRLVVMEAVIAFEAFVTSHLESQVWGHEHFTQSKGNRNKLQRLIMDAGITSLTEVPLRVALSSTDIYRVFSLLDFPVRGGLLSAESLLSAILTGITVRNDIVHKGRTQVDRKIAEDLLASAYFLIEAVLLNIEEAEGGRSRTLSDR